MVVNFPCYVKTQDAVIPAQMTKDKLEKWIEELLPVESEEEREDRLRWEYENEEREERLRWEEENELRAAGFEETY